MSARSARIEAGQFHLPRAAKWLIDFRTEPLQFPHGKYDDQVDSLSQFLNWVEQRPRNRWTVQPFLV
jgi:phage terminase large subunit-like protein